jgi:bifunctional DNA-binding transcriptional regulator/antitoxin component of YhaV-PrlF toxin-antitoxin module
MITIPAAFRKNFNLKDRDKVLIIEDEDTLKIIPIKDPETLRINSYNTEEMKKEMNKSRKEELERELLMKKKVKVNNQL